jgi:hypothetical protein
VQENNITADANVMSNFNFRFARVGVNIWQQSPSTCTFFPLPS